MFWRLLDSALLPDVSGRCACSSRVLRLHIDAALTLLPPGDTWRTSHASNQESLAWIWLKSKLPRVGRPKQI
jgi:hypothetical protein